MITPKEPDDLDDRFEFVVDEDTEPGDPTGALAELLLDMLDKEEQQPLTDPPPAAGAPPPESR